MAINKKLITFTSKEIFTGANGLNNTTEPDASGNYGNIPKTSIVFILDTGEIWTHGKYISGGVWGEKKTDNYISLSIGKTSHNLSLEGHTHSQYLTEHQDLSAYAKLSWVSANFSASGHTHDGRYLKWAGSSADTSAMSWGTLTTANGYTILSHASSSEGGDIGWVCKGGQIFQQLDGYYYQNEGKYRVLDTSDSSSFAAASHTHNYLPLSGGTLTGSVTFANKTYNTVGDDSKIGDINVGGTLGLKGANGQTALAFVNQTNDYFVKLLSPVVTSNIIVNLPSRGGTLALTDHTHDYVDAGKNKWIFTEYSTTSNIITIKELIKSGLTAGGVYTQDDTKLDCNLTGSVYGTNFTIYAKTYILFSADYEYTATFASDDGSSVYLNKTIILESISSCKKTTLTLPFKKGWNVVEVVFHQGGGYYGFRFGDSIKGLSTLTNVIRMDCFVNAVTTTYWDKVTADNVNSATNLVGGAVGSIPYQSATNTTTFLDASTLDGYILAYNTSNKAPEWKNLSDYFAAADAMLYKGVVNKDSDLPYTTAKQGWTYRVGTAGKYNSANCEVGDIIICLTDASTSTNATWTIVQTNIDGAVIGPTNATDAAIARFNSTTGKLILNSKVTIDDSGNLSFLDNSNISWISGSYHQRIKLTDDSTANTSVFTFQQSSDTGSTWSDLFTIYDNGLIKANNFKGNWEGTTFAKAFAGEYKSLKLYKNFTNNTHLLKLGTFSLTDDTYYSATLLITNSFWGTLHYSHTIITISTDQAAGKVVAKITKVCLGGLDRPFYYKINNKTIELYVKVYGGNGYGLWNIRTLSSTAYFNWETNLVEDCEITTDLIELAYGGIVQIAEQLKTARTLWGNLFDGSDNITGNLSSVGNISFLKDNTYNIGTSDCKPAHIYTNNIYTANLYSPDNSTLNIYSDNSINFYLQSSSLLYMQYITITNAGKTGILNSNPGYTLDVMGDIYSSSSVISPVFKIGTYGYLREGDGMRINNSDTITSKWENGLIIENRTNEASGIHMDNNGIHMWAADDGLEYYDEDSGNLMWSIDEYGNFSGNSANSDKLSGKSLNIANRSMPFETIPYIEEDGVIEIGGYINMHYDNTTGSDYSTRIMITGNYSNIVKLPSTSGTLALNDQTYITSLGTLNSQTERTQEYSGIYTYNTTEKNTANPTQYSSIIGFGKGSSGTVEIAGGWCNTNLFWRSLRDVTDNWYAWRTIIDSTNISSQSVSYATSAGNASTVGGVSVAGYGGTSGLMRSWARGKYTSANAYFGNGNVVTIDPKGTGGLTSNDTILSLGDSANRNTQLLCSYNSDGVYYRRIINTDAYGDWKKLAFSSEIPDVSKLYYSNRGEYKAETDYTKLPTTSGHYTLIDNSDWYGGAFIFGGSGSNSNLGFIIHGGGYTDVHLATATDSNSASWKDRGILITSQSIGSQSVAHATEADKVDGYHIKVVSELPEDVDEQAIYFIIDY